MKKLYQLILLFILGFVPVQTVYAAQAVDFHAIMQEEKELAACALEAESQERAVAEETPDYEVSIIQLAPSAPITQERKAQLDRTLARQRQQITALREKLEEEEALNNDDYLDIEIETVKDLSHELCDQMMTTAALSLAVAYKNFDWTFDPKVEGKSRIWRWCNYKIGKFAARVLSAPWLIKEHEALKKVLQKNDPFGQLRQKAELVASYTKNLNKGHEDEKGAALVSAASIQKSAEDHETRVKYRYAEYASFFTLLKLLEIDRSGSVQPLSLKQLASIAYEQIVYLSMMFGLSFPADVLVKYNPIDIVEQKSRRLISQQSISLPEFEIQDVKFLLTMSKKMLLCIDSMSDDLGILFSLNRYESLYTGLINQVFEDDKFVRGGIEGHFLCLAKKYRRQERLYAVQGVAPVPITQARKAQLDRTLARQCASIATRDGESEEKEFALEFERLDVSVGDVSHELYNQMMTTAALSLTVAFNSFDKHYWFSVDSQSGKKIKKNVRCYYQVGKFASQALSARFKNSNEFVKEQLKKYDPFKQSVATELLVASYKKNLNNAVEDEKGAHLLSDADLEYVARDHKLRVDYRHFEYATFFAFLKLLEVDDRSPVQPLTLVQLASISYEQIVYLAMMFGLPFPADLLARYNPIDIVARKNKQSIPLPVSTIEDVQFLLNISKKMIASLRLMADDLGIPFQCNRHEALYLKVIDAAFGIDGNTSVRMQEIILGYSERHRIQIQQECFEEISRLAEIEWC